MIVEREPVKIEWREIKGYEGMYEVSNDGQVRGIDRQAPLPNGKTRFAKGKLLKLSISNRGYVEVRLNNNGQSKSHRIHRLVAQAFLPNEEGLPQVNHLDGCKTNNHVENLEWSDARKNALHAYQMGLNKQCGCTHTFAVPIIDIATGELYCSIKALCEFLGINYNSGKNAIRGQQPFPKWVDLSGHSFERYNC